MDIAPDESADDTNTTAPLPTPTEEFTRPPAPAPWPTPPGTPPVRWGGVIWGALLIVFACLTLAIVSSPARVAGVTVWIATLTPGAAVALWVAALGLVIVVLALLGAIGGAQRRRRRRPL